VVFSLSGGKSMVLIVPMDGPRSYQKGVLYEELEQPENKEGQTFFSDELDENGFPTVLQFQVTEVKMFLRIVSFLTCKVVWEKRSQDLHPFDYLVGLQYLEWYENLSITSHLFNKESQMIYTIWNYLLTPEGSSARNSSQDPYIVKLRERINMNKETLGHLTFLHYRAELTRDTFLRYIRTTVIQKRSIQRESNPRPSHFKRSSDHSSSSSRSASRGENPSEKVRWFTQEEQLSILEFPTQERKNHSLLSGNSRKTIALK
jgi:hypothetical protein